MNRPEEELYDITEDRYEMNNLINDPEYNEIKQKLSKELDRWMKEQNDPGSNVDTIETLEAIREGKYKI